MGSHSVTCHPAEVTFPPLPTLVVTHQLQVERRTEKVRRPETDVLPLICGSTCNKLLLKYLIGLIIGDVKLRYNLDVKNFVYTFTYCEISCKIEISQSVNLLTSRIASSESSLLDTSWRCSYGPCLFSITVHADFDSL